MRRPLDRDLGVEAPEAPRPPAVHVEPPVAGEVFLLEQRPVWTKKANLNITIQISTHPYPHKIRLKLIKYFSIIDFVKPGRKAVRVYNGITIFLFCVKIENI